MKDFIEVETLPKCETCEKATASILSNIQDGEQAFLCWICYKAYGIGKGLILTTSKSDLLKSLKSDRNTL